MALGGGRAGVLTLLSASSSSLPLPSPTGQRHWVRASDAPVWQRGSPQTHEFDDGKWM